MAENSLEKSEEMIALIVNSLAERGVITDGLTVVDVGLEFSEENENLFVDAIKWLRWEGIIRSDSEHEFYSGGENGIVADDFTLTSYGFALLQQPFDGELTLGGAIKTIKKAGSGYSSIGDLVGGILGGFTKSIAS